MIKHGIWVGIWVDPGRPCFQTKQTTSSNSEMLQAATWRTKGLGATLPPKDIKEPTKLGIQPSMGHHGDVMAREISWNIWCISIYLYIYISIYIYKHQSYVWVGLKMRDLPNGQCHYNFGRKYDQPEIFFG